jgi:hypothetical protein
MKAAVAVLWLLTAAPAMFAQSASSVGVPQIVYDNTSSGVAPAGDYIETVAYGDDIQLAGTSRRLTKLEFLDGSRADRTRHLACPARTDRSGHRHLAQWLPEFHLPHRGNRASRLQPPQGSGAHTHCLDAAVEGIHQLPGSAEAVPRRAGNRRKGRRALSGLLDFQPAR